MHAIFLVMSIIFAFIYKVKLMFVINEQLKYFTWNQ